ncbi:MAG: hypothetical protein L0Y71_02845 [Gemmataceae bacterium]|nr:hypothetical protein [Gemmataceae bacterium]
MAAVSGVNIAMLPQEHAAFWEYLATTGDIWACALGDNPLDRQFEPAPVAAFVQRFAKKIVQYDTVSILLGHRQSVLNPSVGYVEETVDGTEELLSAPGVFPKISRIVGGKKVRRPHLNHAASQLIRYNYGVINRDNVMNRTTTSFYSTYLVGKTFRRHPDEFLKWARKATGWLRRRIAGQAPVHRCNYEIPASALAIEAVKEGLKVV